MAKISSITNRVSVKTKSVIGIVALVLVLSTLNLITYSVLRRYVRTLSAMIDSSVRANDLRVLAGKVTEGLPFDVETYTVRPTPENKQRVYDTFTMINKNLDELSGLIEQDEIHTSLALVKNMFSSSSEIFEQIVIRVEEGQSFLEINKDVLAIRESSELIHDSMQNLIATKLSYDQASKVALSNRVDINGWLLVLVIVLSSLVGTVIFYRVLLKRSILAPLDNLQRMMGKVASDASDIKLRVTVEREDEIGQLGDHFNKMADTIQQYKENLEALVETRTKQLVNSQAMLAQAGKLSSLGEMAGGIAHEVNNPVAIISLLSSEMQDNLADEPIDKPELRRLAATIHGTATRISKIVNGLRAFSRDATHDPFEAFSVNTIVNDSIALCAEKFRSHGVALSVLPLAVDATMDCRPTEISQVLLNLLNNAYDAVSGQPSPWIEVRVQQHASSIEIWVTDSGTGIPADIAEKVFQPFFTLKPIGKGTGLGLSISSGIVTGHRGKIWIDKLCPNTRFAIEIPLMAV